MLPCTRRPVIYRYGRSGYDLWQNRFPDAKCYKKEGYNYIASVWQDAGASVKQDQVANGVTRDMDKFQRFTIASCWSPPITVNVLVEDNPLTMKVNTGAASLKNRLTFHMSQIKLPSFNIVLKIHPD